MARNETNETLARIEKTQAELIESIEKSKALAAESDELLRKHRAESRSAIPLKPSRP